MSSPSPEPLTPDADRQWAILGHALGIFTVLGPLIVWLLFRDRGQRTNMEAKEALNFQLTVLLAIAALTVVGVLLNVISFGTLGFVIGGAVWLVQLSGVIFAIVGAIMCAQQGSYRYPIAVRLIR
ncbi:MAG: DUF4870 domain-containing protein [Mycetocola sp.]